VLGTDYVDYDRNARSLFSPDSIYSQIEQLSKKDRNVFEGYAAGINAWLSEVRTAPGTRMPKQFIDIGFEPADWTAYDVIMIFVGTMMNRYGDYTSELENAAILASLIRQHGEDDGRALFDLLNPRFTDDAPTTIPRQDWSRAAYDSMAGSTINAVSDTVVADVTFEAPPTGFSNVYLLGRDKVDGANSILINGPQFGWYNPSYVYSVGLHGAGVNVVGNSPFGYPMIMFGHNERIAWGSTWGASDIVDIFALELNPEDDGQYRYDGAVREFERRSERISVRDGDVVDHVVLRSVHGPVIGFSDDGSIAFAKKRSWEGGELDNLLAWLYATWAPDWESWKAEVEKASINVNMYYADVDGNIGYFHGGHFPVRAAGHDNRFPVTGDGSMDWAGRQPVDSANPHILNPTGGVLANWNNKPGHGVMNPEFFYYSWSTADRVEYLHQALSGRRAFSADEAWNVIVGSSYGDVAAPYLLPAIDKVLAESDDSELREANERLQSWHRHSRDDDGDGYYDEPATALFRYFVERLVERALEDDLGEVYAYFGGSGYPTADQPSSSGTNLPTGLKAIIEALNGRGDYDLFNGEPAAVVIIAAMTDAIELAREAPLPVATRPYRHTNFLGIPQALDSEVMTGSLEQNRGTENNMIIMKPGEIIGWEVTPPGQSGFIDPGGVPSPHYDDQFELFHSFGRKRTWFYPGDVEANKKSEVTLTY
jgi:penicillin amidase